MNHSSLHARGILLFMATAGGWSLPAIAASVMQNPYTDRNGVVCIDNQVPDIYRRAGGPRLDFSAVPPGSPLESDSEVWPLIMNEADLSARGASLSAPFVPLDREWPMAGLGHIEAAPPSGAPESPGLLVGGFGALLLLVSSPAKRRRRTVTPPSPWRAA